MNEGFFTLREMRSSANADGKARSCVSCGLYKEVLNPRMLAFGNFRKGILNVGEAPGETEDQRGRPWQGKVGRALQQAYKELGVDLFEDCLNINSVNCRPTDSKGGNREPSPQEISDCRCRVLSIIESYKPKVIMLFGTHAVQSLIGYRWMKDLGSISRWRGWRIPDRDFNAWLCPQFHPSFVERGEKEVQTIWMKDLKQALDMVKVPFPKYEDETKQIEIVTDLSFLPTLTGPIYIDYETTGLKPHNTLIHRIVCMSVCNRPDKAYVFMTPEDVSQLKYIRMMLRNNEPKCAQHMSFEERWTYNIFGYHVNNWSWDPMLASHVLDNRREICGLKFQVYVNFGVVDYDSEVEPFLRSLDKKDGNSTNRIMDLVKTEAGRLKLQIYCGMDSLFEYRLGMIQMRQLGV